MSFYFTIDETVQGTHLTVPVFSTSQLTKNLTLSQEEYNNLNFDNVGSPSDAFTYEMTQAMQFSPISDNVWGITKPKK